MNIQLSFFILGVFVRGAHGLSCGECNHDNTTESCGPPPSCEETVLDACGCCPLCAKLENESCGGPWNTLGSCADGLVCHPVSTDKPVLGAGGYYSESWDPAGICVNSYNYQRDHSRCAQLLAAYQDFLKALEGQSTNDDPDMTARDDDDDDTTVMTTTTTTTQTETTTIGCVRKPSCTPDGGFAPLQCDGCAGECWCAFHDGREIRGTRGHYRSVRC